MINCVIMARPCLKPHLTSLTSLVGGTVMLRKVFLPAGKEQPVTRILVFAGRVTVEAAAGTAPPGHVVGSSHLQGVGKWNRWEGPQAPLAVHAMWQPGLDKACTAWAYWVYSHLEAGPLVWASVRGGGC